MELLSPVTSCPTGVTFKVRDLFSFQVPPASNFSIIGLTLCVVYSADKHLIVSFGDIVIKNSTKNFEWPPISKCTVIPFTRKDHMWFIHIPHATLENQLEEEDEVEVSVIYDCSVSWMKCGIQLVYE